MKRDPPGTPAGAGRSHSAHENATRPALLRVPGDRTAPMKTRPARHPCGCRAIALGAELNRPDSLRLRAAVALRNLEFDSLTFFKSAVAVRLNSREVDENVPTTVDRDKAVALIRVEPFDGALSHEQQLPNFCSGFGSRPCYAKPVDRGAGWTCCASSACRSRRTDSDRTLHYMVATPCVW